MLIYVLDFFWFVCFSFLCFFQVVQWFCWKKICFKRFLICPLKIIQKYIFLQSIIKILGTIFLIYLAYKFAFSSTNVSEQIKKPVNFFDTFLFQFINPKGVMVAMIAVSTFIDVENNYLRDATIVIATYFFMAVFSVSSWCLLGKYLRKFATSKNFIKKFNYTMSFLLIVCVIMFYV